MKDSAVPDTDPSVVLTEYEIKQLKAMKPRVGRPTTSSSNSMGNAGKYVALKPKTRR